MDSRTDWNALADNFENLVVDVVSDETSDQLSRFVKATPLAADAVLVDLGCGIGTFIERFGHLFAEIIGVEHAPRIIARARKRCAEIEGTRWIAMDAAQASKQIGPCADLTVCLNVITSASAATRTAQWSSLRAVTKPSGFVLIVVPSMESERMVQKVSARAGHGEATGFTADGLAEKGGSWQKHYKRSELISILTGHGFDVRRVARVYAPWSREGLRKPRSCNVKGPWDWICLAQRPVNVS